MISLKEWYSLESGLKMEQWIHIGCLLCSSLKALWLLLCNLMLEELTLPSIHWFSEHKSDHISKNKSLKVQKMVLISMVCLFRDANAIKVLDIYKNLILSICLSKCLWFGLNLSKLMSTILRKPSTHAHYIKHQPEKELYRQRVIPPTSSCILE